MIFVHPKENYGTLFTAFLAEANEQEATFWKNSMCYSCHEFISIGKVICADCEVLRFESWK